MNRPNRYFSRDALDDAQVSFEGLRWFYEEKDWMCDRIDKLEEDLNTLKRMTPYGAINYIRYGIGYEEYLKEYAQYRKIKTEELFEVMEELALSAKGFKSFSDWFVHIEEYTQQLKEQAKKQASEKKGITISTLHSIKGLEFDADHPVGDIVKKALEKGLIIISAGNNVIRFVPPLVIEKEHVDEMISILEDCIA